VHLGVVESVPTSHLECLEGYYCVEIVSRLVRRWHL
jgi:hypothetical protein